ncbi:MAG: heavy metal translocating P-type ATPase [Candidatus Methanofastidiosia archaeon]|jgi:Cd2+/Zn2+-exporting ATPase
MEKYSLQGLTCAECALNLEKGLSELDCVNQVQVNFATSTLFIDCENMETVTKKMKEIEPEVDIVTESESETKSELDYTVLLKKDRIFIILSALIFVAGLATTWYFDTIHYILEYFVFLTAYVLAGRKVLKNAVFHSIQGHIFDENFLMTIATLGAIAIHQLPEAVGVMLFYSVGEYFEEVSVGRSRGSIKSLLELRPDYAHVLTDDTITQVDPETVSIGDFIVVNPGEKIPLDGIIVHGETTVDTSALTGESLPRYITSGEQVLAGMINQTKSVTVKVTKPFGESSISKILDLVENASARKAESEKFMTRFAKVYTPLVVAAALGVAIIPPVVLGVPLYEWVYRALVLLVISCPCALVISIPLGYFAGIGKASKEGILVKGANFMDALTHLKAVIFDKTGTLTKGEFNVSTVVPQNGFTSREVLQYAAAAEMYSSHPIARSILEAYPDPDTTDITDYEEIPARGVKAIVDKKRVFVGNDRQLHEEEVEHYTCHVEGTVAHVTVDGVYAGYIIIADEAKGDALKTVDALKDMGVTVVMLTGDSEDTAVCIAQELGILRVYWELLPEQKVEKLEEIKEEVESEEKIAFVGDGINDAPVIARADVGIAMGALGSDAAVETADVVIMTDRLYKVVEAVNLSKKVHSAIWQNIVLVLGVKGVFIGMGILGVATMWEAVFADVGVALLAVFNVSRILR